MIIKSGHSFTEKDKRFLESVKEDLAQAKIPSKVPGICGQDTRLKPEKECQKVIHNQPKKVIDFNYA